MTNCCFERCCLLNPPLKCCFRNCKPIILEIIYFIGQLISVIFLIWGKAKIPWDLYKKSDNVVVLIDNGVDSNKPYLKVLYNIGFITAIIKLAFFFIILIFRIAKLINGVLNTLILIFCYIIYYVDSIGASLLTIAIIIIVSDFTKTYSDSHHLIDPFKMYPVVLWVFIVNVICQFLIQIPFQVDIQLIRFKTDLSYDEYKKQNPKTDVQNKNEIENKIENTSIENTNNVTQGENITPQNNIENSNETQNKIAIPPIQQNINGQQKPQNQ